MVDNFEQVMEMMSFSNEGDIYFLELLVRGKDRGTTGEHLIRDYHIRSVEQLESLKDEIIAICNATGARAYIRLNKCNIDVANTLAIKECLLRDAERKAAILSGHKPNKIVSISKIYGSVLGSLSQQAGECKDDPVVEPKKTRKWIVDVDASKSETAEMTAQRFISVINDECEPKGVDKIVAVLPSKNGIHLVTRPFNKKAFGDIVGTDTNGDSFVKTSATTNLYIP